MLAKKVGFHILAILLQLPLPSSFLNLRLGMSACNL